MYCVVWSGGSKFTAKVKSIGFKFSLSFKCKIRQFDVESTDEKLVIVQDQLSNKLCFYDVWDTEKEGLVQVDKEVYSTDTFTEIVDFYVAKDQLLSGFDVKGFIMVQTRISKQMQKVFSLNGVFGDIYRCKFSFFVKNRGETAKLSAIFSHLENDQYKQYLITNLEGDKQTVVSHTSTYVLDYAGFERILNFDISSLDHITVLLYHEDCMISKYVLSMKDGLFPNVKSKETLLVTKHVRSEFYIYNESCAYTFGKLPPELENFEAYKRVVSDKLGFKALQTDFKEILTDSYWSLLNESQFIVVSPGKSTVSNFVIDKEKRITLKEELPFNQNKKVKEGDSLRPNAVRFLKNGKRKVSFAIEQAETISVFEVIFAIRQIESVVKIIELDKKEVFGRSDVIFYQLNLLKTPGRVYKIYALVNPKRVASIEFATIEKCLQNPLFVDLNEEIFQIYKCKQFPYNLTLLSKSENLIILNNKLQTQMTFSLNRLRPFLSAKHKDDPLLANFNLKHLYDRFYIV